MALLKKIQRLGGSVAVVIPKSVADLVGLHPGENAHLDVEDGKLYVRPERGSVEFMTDEEFARVEKRVVRRYGETFRLLAEYDRKRR